MTLPIDWNEPSVIIMTSKLPEWEKDDVSAAVVTAVDKWAPEDFGKIVAVEQVGELPAPHKIDIILRDDNGYIICDWKTKKTLTLDERWEMRETRSPQKRIYTAALASIYGTDIFPLRYQVRGLAIGDAKKIRTKVLASVITPEQAKDALLQLRKIATEREGLLEHYPDGPWPRHMGGCRMFGDAYACKFEKHCFDGAPLIPSAMEVISKPFSHSSASDYLRCPELYRCSKSEPKVIEEDEEADSSTAGQVFHLVMENIYKQLLKAQHVEKYVFQKWDGVYKKLAETD